MAAHGHPDDVDPAAAGDAASALSVGAGEAGTDCGPGVIDAGAPAGAVAGTGTGTGVGDGTGELPTGPQPPLGSLTGMAGSMQS